MFSSEKTAAVYNQIGLHFSATRPKLPAKTRSLLPRLPKDARVLDLGCGNGVLATALPESVDYTGLDFSQTLLNEAKRFHPRQRFVLADIARSRTWQNLETYDFIAALAVFHHLSAPDDHIKLLQNIKNHLKPAGSVLISVWHLDQPKFDRFRNGAKHLSIPFRRGPERSFYAFGKNEIPQLAEKTGFGTIISHRQGANFFYLLKLRPDSPPG